MGEITRHLADGAFTLGMPHLGPQGIGEAWLMRRAAHLHWAATARHAGCSPSGLRDATGARAMASFVSARVTGSLDAFCEDDLVDLSLVRPPRPENGWHSRVLLRRLDGDGTAAVELVSRFARRGGPSNRRIEAAQMPDEMRSAPEEALPNAARVLRARARSLRKAAPPAGAPLVSMPVLAEADLNGVGLLYFANFLRFFAAAEGAALAGSWRVPSVSLREVHWYGNADAGDRIDLTCALHVSRGTPDLTSHAFLTARRASDDTLIAACETIRVLGQAA